MNVYEFVVLFKPDLTDEQLKEGITRIQTLVENNGGTPLQANFWGKKKLAYEVKKYSKGYYVHFVFVAEPGFIKELERTTRINQSIMKYLTVRLDETPDLVVLKEKYPPSPDPFARRKEETQVMEQHDESKKEEPPAEKKEDIPKDEDAGEDDAGEDDAGEDDAGEDDAGEDDAGEDDDSEQETDEKASPGGTDSENDEQGIDEKIDGNDKEDD